MDHLIGLGGVGYPPLEQCATLFHEARANFNGIAASAGEDTIVTAVFTAEANVSGTIKYHVDAAVFLDSQEYNVAVGSNTFKVRFTAGSDSYSCLELGGLGAFKLTFTGISVMEVENP